MGTLVALAWFLKLSLDLVLKEKMFSSMKERLLRTVNDDPFICGLCHLVAMCDQACAPMATTGSLKGHDNVSIL